MLRMQQIFERKRSEMRKSKGKKEDELKQRRRGMKMKKKRNEEIEGKQSNGNRK